MVDLQWLVWIQLLVMILLIALLYCCSLYASEICDADVRVSVSSSAGGLLFGSEDAENLGVDRETRTSFLQSRLKVVGSSNIRGEISTAGVGRRVTRSQNGTEGDAASVKDITSNRDVAETRHHHPCSIFKFAREAFLKCLGLDFMAENSNTRKQGKND